MAASDLGDKFPFKSVGISEMEEAIAIAFSALTGTPTRVDIASLEHVSDGADSFIGQQRYKISLSLVTERLQEKE